MSIDVLKGKSQLLFTSNNGKQSYIQIKKSIPDFSSPIRISDGWNRM